MTAVHHLPARTGLAAKLLSLTVAVRTAFLRQARYRVTMRELARLSDRDLADLGIHRAMIGQVARDAALRTA